MNKAVQPKYSYNDLLDAVEVQMHKNGIVNIPIVHQFTPGLYTRSMVDVPPETYILSHIHSTEHQFIMSAGQIVIYSEDGAMVLFQSPYLGVTEPGTRRLAKTTDYVTWTSIHATDIFPKDNTQKAFDEAVRLVEIELYEKHDNVFLIKAA